MCMDDIKLFVKNEKELETLIQAVTVYSDDIGMEFSIEKFVMIIMKSKRQQMTEGIELLNQEKIRTPNTKGNLQILGNIGSGHHQTCREERKNWKRISWENEKTTRNQTTLQKSYRKMNT